ncbi:MAG: hypothetical protein ABJA82_07760 [Myxococcales bacterium]
MTIRNASAELPAPRAVLDTDGELAKVGPLTRIRATGVDGATPWHEAGELWISQAGLVRTPVRLGSIVSASVAGIDARDAIRSELGCDLESRSGPRGRT